MPSSLWTIQLLGKFKISAPDGVEISISSRKAKALFALLALNDGIAVTRESLATHLWPDKPKPLQQQNFRQALKELREAFAPVEAIAATRDACRLSLEEYRCDATECLIAERNAGNLTLLPEMPEPVFDSYRAELASFTPSGELGEAVRSASTLLAWALGEDSSRVLALLHSFRELIPNMPVPQVEAAFRIGLEQAEPGHPLRAWASAQFASVLIWSGRHEEGIAAAKAALGFVKPELDSQAWTATAHSAAIFMIFRGRFSSAKKLLDEAIEIASHLGLADAENRLRHAEALRLGYEGHIEEALKVLAGLTPNELILIHQAIYLAILNRPAEARNKLQEGRSLVHGAVDPRLASQMLIAEAQILIQEGQGKEATTRLLDWASVGESQGFRLIQIHALESLALAAVDPTAKANHLEKAMELRQRYRFPLLPGDRIRLASVLSQERI